MDERFETLATRGTARGADAVLGAALGAARRADRDADSDASTRNEVASERHESTPIVELDDAPARRVRATRRKWRTALAAGGLAALLGVVSLGVAALLGGGGANSPEGAVRQLASAIDQEDPLAAVDVLQPDEVQSLHGTVDTASKRAAQIDLVKSAGSPFAGVDFGVRGLDLHTEMLAPGYAKVSVDGGALSFGGNASEFAAMLREAVREMPSNEFDFATNRPPFGLRPFVMTVQRDGNWYVSPAYTVLEYVREANELPAAEFGSGRAAAARLGATSPALAVRGALEAYSANDWNGLFSFAPPNEFPVYDYRAALSTLIARNNRRPHFTIDHFFQTTSPDGDHATVAVRADGSFADGNTWSLDNDCLNTTQSYTDDDGTRATAPGGFCLERGGSLPYNYMGQTDEQGTVQFVTERHDGRWFVSPVGSVLNYVDDWVAHVDHNDIAALLGDYAAIEPTGEISLGHPVTVQPLKTSAFTFRVAQMQKIVGQMQHADAWPGGGASVVVVDEAGRIVVDSQIGLGVPGSIQPGTYHVVVQSYAHERLTLTLWNLEDAPPGVVNKTFPDGTTCEYDPTGGGLCDSGSVTSGSGSAPAPFATQSESSVSETTIAPAP